LIVDQAMVEELLAIDLKGIGCGDRENTFPGRNYDLTIHVDDGVTVWAFTPNLF
jgi:hypothetical protein